MSVGVGVGPVEASASREMFAVAVFVGSARLVAFTVTLAALGMDDGAVYNPVREIVPIAGLKYQAIAVFVVPQTNALNCWVCPAESLTLFGPMLMETLWPFPGAAKDTAENMSTNAFTISSSFRERIVAWMVVVVLEQ